MQQSTACLHFAWRTTSLRVGGRLGVAACLACVAAAAVDRQARQSCRIWCGGVNWTIDINVFRLQNIRSVTVLSCRETSAHRRGRHDTDRTVLSGLAWRCELGIRFKNSVLRGGQKLIEAISSNLRSQSYMLFITAPVYRVYV